jgi:hypothetical protein
MSVIDTGVDQLNDLTEPENNPNDLKGFDGFNAGNLILAGNDNSIVDCRRCTIINGQSNTIGAEGRPNGKYNTHIIGSNKTAQKNNIFYIACSNGMSVTGDIVNTTDSWLTVNGNAHVGGNVNVVGDVIGSSLSDEKLKLNKLKISKSTDKINKINPYSFTWNNRQSVYTGNDIGFIAQEVQEIIPFAVKHNKSKFLSMQYKKIIPILIASIQEKQVRINNLVTKINSLRKGN